MSNCNEVNVIFPDAVDDVVGKTRSDPFAEFASADKSTGVRVSRNTFDCLLDGQ